MLDISTLDEASILQPDVFAELLDTPSQVERVELEDKLIEKAKELGVKTAFKRRLTAYKKDNIKANPFICPFELQLSDKGIPLDTIDNYVQILRHDPRYAGKLRLNELSSAPEKHEDGKRMLWTDDDDAEVRRYIEKTYNINLKSYKKVRDAMRIVFSENRYNPVKQKIEGIKWDKKPRIKDFLCKWLGVEDEPYAREVSRLIFAGGIHRIYEPGCKFDEMPVLVGRQGGGKSTFVRWLAMDDEFFREVTEIDGQKGIEALSGAWMCEMGELLALTRAKDVEAVKAYLTRQRDHYRRPYDERTTDHPRQCIFIGTTNKLEFLTDKTGNRRYYPVVCNNTGYDLFKNERTIKHEIEQCWAEAKYLYDIGKLPPVADKDLLSTIRAHQEMAVEDDYRVGMIKAYLDKREMVCAIELWQNALKEYGKPTRRDSNDISVIMQTFPGWVKSTSTRRFSGYDMQKYWYKNTTK